MRNNKLRFNLGCLFLFAVLAVQSLVPALIPSSSVSAAPGPGTSIDLLAYDLTVNPVHTYENSKIPLLTCAPYIVPNKLEDDPFLKANVGFTSRQLQDAINNKNGTSYNLDKKYNFLGTLTKTQAQYIVDNKGNPINIIKFAHVSGAAVNGSQFDETPANKCDQYVMLPIADGQWRGYQETITDDNTISRDGPNEYNDYMEFIQSATDTATQTTSGSFRFYDRSQVDDSHSKIALEQGTSLTVAGLPKGCTGSGCGGNTNVGLVSVEWVNITTLRIAGTSPYKGEIYTKSKWNKHSDYYLTSVPPAESATRGHIIINPDNSAAHCSEDEDCSVIGGNNVVPFIHINGHIDFNDTSSNGFEDLRTRVKTFSTSSATFYNYGTDGIPIPAGTSGSPVKLLPNGLAPYVWFAYSRTKDQFVSLFSDGASNEGPYIGTYEDKGNNSYTGPNGTCVGDITATKPTATETISAIHWELKDSKCQTSYGTFFGVNIVGAAASPMLAINDENLFAGANTNITNVQSRVSTSVASAPKLACDVSIINPITWVVCPIISAAEGLVAKLDDAINTALTVNVNQIFTIKPGCANASQASSLDCTGYAYHAAWATFRGFGLGLIVIGGLVSIIAYALGFELFDAYTIKKILPRLILVVIGISLSWYIMKFFVELSNAAGLGVRSLIYAPFKSIGEGHLGGGSTFSLGLIGGAAAVSLGLMGLLSLAVTAALAVAIGFGTIVVRNLLIIMLVMLAPLGIACAVLPNTQKAWKLWYETFTKALLVFPIITAFIASGRVFAVMSTRSPGVVNSLVGFVAYFAPYFLISLAFRLAGGFIGQLGGIANNRSKGAFDRLKKFRGQKTAENFSKMKSGDRFQGSNALARGFNRTTGRAGLGVRGHFGFGARGEGAEDIHRRAAARAASQNDHGLQQLAYDDNAIAVMALSGGTAAGARRAARRLGLNADEARRAVNTAQAVGFTDTNTFAAADLMAQNKSRAFTTANGLAGQAGMELVRASLGAASGGNAQLTENTMGSFAFHSRNAGRLDLGGETVGNTFVGGWQRASVGQHAQAYGASTETFLNDFVGALNGPEAATDADRFDPAGQRVAYTAAEKMASAVGLSEMQAALPSATAENQVNINRAMAAVQVDHTSNLTIEEQLANRVNGLGATDTPVGPLHPDVMDAMNERRIARAKQISGSARQYASQQPLGTRGQAPPTPTPPPGPTP